MSYQINIMFDNLYAERSAERGRQKQINKYRYEYKLYYIVSEEDIINKKSLHVYKNPISCGKPLDINGRKFRKSLFASINLQKITNLNPGLTRKLIELDIDKLRAFYSIVKSNLSPCWGYKPEPTTKKKPYST